MRPDPENRFPNYERGSGLGFRPQASKLLEEGRALAFQPKPKDGGSPDATKAAKDGKQPPYDGQFSQQDIDRLIVQLGDRKFAKRNEAREQLEKIGLPAMSRLENAVQNNRDAEIRIAARGISNRIEREHGRELFQDWEKKLNAAMPGWAELQQTSGISMIHNEQRLMPGNKDNPPGPPAIEDGAGNVVPVGTILAIGSNRRAPNKQEQEKIEAFIKQLDTLQPDGPAFQKKLKEAEKKAQDPNATIGERGAYLTMFWQQRAYHEAREMYARALAQSNDPADLKKGAPMFMDALKASTENMSSPVTARDVVSDALKFCRAMGPEFTEQFIRTFKEKGATDEQINAFRARLAKDKKE
jgi:hypothetical protein